MKTIRAGLVGAGNRGRTHAERYADVPGTEVVAVADIDLEKAHSLADEFDADAAYESHERLLEDDAVDVVNVCLHNHLHEPVTLDALAAGKHVFCEKPMATSYGEARRMYDAATDADRRLAVQNRKLYSPPVQAAKRLVDDGRLGDVYLGRAANPRRRGRPYVDGYGSPPFVREETAGGGALYDLGPYEIGKLLYLMGNPEIVTVRGKTFDTTEAAYDEERVGDSAEEYQRRLAETGYDVEDGAVGFVEFEDGATLTIRVAWAMNGEKGERSEVIGSKGGVQLDPFEFRTTVADVELTASGDVDLHEFRKHQLDGTEEAQSSGAAYSHLYHWIQALRRDESPIPSDELALKAMLVMDGIYLSSERSREFTAEEIVEASTDGEA